MNNKIFEWAGVITAILYSLFVALNIGIEFFGFCLLLISAILIGIWAYRGGHRGILFLVPALVLVQDDFNNSFNKIRMRLFNN